MRQLTGAQERGFRFEIWLEEVFKNVAGIYNLRRNVEFHKERYLFRQADLAYNTISQQGLELVIIEAKYSSNGPIKYKLRSPKEKQGQPIPKIDNLVDEIIERQYFIGANKSVLITNKTFDKELISKGLANHIYLIDGTGLQKILLQQQKRVSNLEASIQRIHLNGQVSKKNIIYIS